MARSVALASPTPSGFVHLAVRLNFSFLQGASPPARLVSRARELGYDAVAIADRDGLYGAVRAYEGAKDGIRLVLGCEVTLDPEPEDGLPSVDGPTETFRPRPTLLLHVQNQTGYTNLCRILTESHARHPKGKARAPEDGVPRNCFAGIPLSSVATYAEGLWATWPLPPAPTVSSPRDLALLREAFGDRASLAVHAHLHGGDRARVEEVAQRGAQHGLPLVATNAVLYARKADKRVLDVLHCIREGTTLDQAGRALAPNAEAHLKSEPEMRRVFARFKGHDAWFARSRTIADACTFDLRSISYHFPFEIDEPAFPGETPDQALRRLTYAGAEARIGQKLTGELAARIEHELGVIGRLRVAPYFLSVQIIVQIAREKHILCQGRGSAANSVVCFCLGITAVDPTQSSMLFERFLSEDRKHEPPDIDVDFEHERREEVIQAIYARYGRERAAMVSEVVSYRAKSALREVGKVFGFSLEQTGRLGGLVEWWDRLHEVDGPRLAAAGFAPDDDRVRLTLEMAKAIVGFPRHLSIHVGGFVLSSTPLVEVAPIEPATMADRTIIPWDKDDIDTLGFFKVDVLALGMLTALRKSLALVQDDPRVAARWPNEQLALIPREDPLVYAALENADTVGVFQIESRAQMAMLPRLKPKNFYDLVVEVALVRPGPIHGGMVHPYLRRRSGEEAPDPPHEILRPILERTLGVPLFQEQVMQIAIVGAGYTGGEADGLRRDMAAWRRNGNLERHRDRLRRGFLERGITEEFAARLYEQIQGFGEYGFPESHAASFALLVYASAWMKVHHPAAFAVGLLNSQPMGFYSPSTILSDAERHGVKVLPVSVLESEWDTTLVAQTADAPTSAPTSSTKAIRVGLRQLRGLAEKTGRRIEACRMESPFATMADLTERGKLDRGELELLAEAGALEGLVAGRREAIWKVQAPKPEGLFAGVDLGDTLPAFPTMTRAEQLTFDYRSTGLSVNDHPMRLVRPTLPESVKSSVDIARGKQGTRASTAGLVICRQRPGTASGVVFITLEDEHGFTNLIVYSRVFEAFREVATGYPLLVAHGILEREDKVVHLVVQRLEPLVSPALREGLGVSMSRDFH